jgi:hypothetical protein
LLVQNHTYLQSHRLVRIPAKPTTYSNSKPPLIPAKITNHNYAKADTEI